MKKAVLTCILWLSHLHVQSFQLLPHLQYDPRISQERGPNFAWENRQTGIVPAWTSGIGFWQHYDVTSLSSQPIVPYTQGYMRKHLKCVNKTAFELWSVYQPQATGGWLLGLMRHTRRDKNWDHAYLFSATPFRINQNPLPNLPDGSTTRVFIVKPGSATLHGTMHLPTVDEVEGHRGPNWQFFELWLAEDYLGFIEGRKVGAVVEFHGLSGCLKQVFQIHEVAEGISERHPNEDIKFDGAALAPVFPTQTDRPHNYCSTLSANEPPWACTTVVHLVDGHMGPDHASEVEGPLMDTGVLDPNVFYTIPLDNGAYLKIPKAFDATLNGEICIEFGCRRLDGDCHRLVVYGDRRKGSYHTICYDKWRD